MNNIAQTNHLRNVLSLRWSLQALALLREGRFSEAKFACEVARRFDRGSNEGDGA